MDLKHIFALAARAIISNQQGNILLVRRSKSSRSFPGKWEFPGGKAEVGETFQESLEREVFEETQLTIMLLHVAGTLEFEIRSRKIACILMECRAESGEVHLSYEHEEYAWVPRARLLEYDLVEHFVSFAQAYTTGAANDVLIEGR